MRRITACLLLIAIFISLFQHNSLSSSNFSLFDWRVFASRHKGKDDAESKLYVAISYANLGQIVDATEVFNSIAKEDYGRIREGIYKEYRGKYERGSRDILSLNLVAFCEYIFGKYEEAVRVLQLLTKVDKDNLWTRVYLAICYSKIGQIDKAITEVKYVLSKDPKNQYAHFLMGLAHKERGEYGKMVLEFMKAPNVVREMIELW